MPDFIGLSPWRGVRPTAADRAGFDAAQGCTLLARVACLAGEPDIFERTAVKGRKPTTASPGQRQGPMGHATCAPFLTAALGQVLRIERMVNPVHVQQPQASGTRREP
jgi:hypothetical protein